MSVIKRTVNLSDYVNSLLEILNELAVPEYFSSIAIDEVNSNTNVAWINFYINDNEEEKLAFVMKASHVISSSTQYVLYGDTQSLSLTITDSTGSSTGHYWYVFATANGIVLSTDGTGTQGSPIVITKDINGDTVFIFTHQFVSNYTTSRTVMISGMGQPAYSAVRPGKSTLFGFGGATEKRYSGHIQDLTTLAPLVLTDGTASYCDKTFMVVATQHFGTGELDIGNDHFIFTSHFAILDS